VTFCTKRLAQALIQIFISPFYTQRHQSTSVVVGQSDSERAIENIRHQKAPNSEDDPSIQQFNGLLDDLADALCSIVVQNPTDDEAYSKAAVLAKSVVGVFSHPQYLRGHTKVVQPHHVGKFNGKRYTIIGVPTPMMPNIERPISPSQYNPDNPVSQDILDKFQKATQELIAELRVHPRTKNTISSQERVLQKFCSSNGVLSVQELWDMFPDHTDAKSEVRAIIFRLNEKLQKKYGLRLQRPPEFIICSVDTPE